MQAAPGHTGADEVDPARSEHHYDGQVKPQVSRLMEFVLCASGETLTKDLPRVDFAEVIVRLIIRMTVMTMMTKTAMICGWVCGNTM